MRKLFAAIVLNLCVLSAPAATLLSEQFTYPNGPLTVVSGGVWTNHSGAALEVDVASGRVNLTENESEDVSAALSGPVTSGILYYGLDLNVSGLPSGEGNYFAMFRDSAFVFRARLYATTNGAVAGSYRLGVATAASTPNVVFNTDISLGTAHRVVVAYDFDNRQTTLWVDPAAESDPNVIATDAVPVLPYSVYSFSLRQSLFLGSPGAPTVQGTGTLTVDNLKVATTFVEAVPEPLSLLPLSLLFVFCLTLSKRERVSE